MHKLYRWQTRFLISLGYYWDCFCGHTILWQWLETTLFSVVVAAAIEERVQWWRRQTEIVVTFHSVLIDEDLWRKVAKKWGNNGSSSKVCHYDFFVKSRSIRFLLFSIYYIVFIWPKIHLANKSQIFQNWAQPQLLSFGPSYVIAMLIKWIFKQYIPNFQLLTILQHENYS